MVDTSKIPVKRIDGLNNILDIKANTSLDNITQLGKDVIMSNSYHIPVGTIISMGTSKTPKGFINCNGAEVSRTTYSKLFQAIGTNYGSGNGSTTFNLPNLNDRVLWGNGTGYRNAGLPNITGMASPTITGNVAKNAQRTGAFSNSSTTNQRRVMDYPHKNPNGFNPLYHDDGNLDFNANNSNKIYGASTTVQPPACLVHFFIKY